MLRPACLALSLLIRTALLAGIRIHVLGILDLVFSRPVQAQDPYFRGQEDIGKAVSRVEYA